MARTAQKHLGKLSMTAKGFGFVRIGEGKDVFIDLEHLNTGMDGDTVEIEIFRTSRDSRPSGRVIRVVERSGRIIIGVFRKTSEGGKVHPEDNRVPTSLFIPADQIRSAKFEQKLATGKIVVAVLERWDRPDTKPVGRITQVIGSENDPGMDLKIIALSKGLALEFPREVEKEARAIRLPDTKKEAAKRLDLRAAEVVTIDPESARDFDDALSLTQRPDGLFDVGIHIADVSHFVPEGSLLDSAAHSRGTSVYFVSSALPMLPERLSSDLCSLKPGQDRLTFSVIARLDSMGSVHEYRITPSVIHSKQRFTYREVEDVLNGKSHKHAKMLHQLELLSRVLRLRREKEGSIDFDIPGKAIVLDRDGVPRSIRPVEQLESQRLVAEFMLLANRLVAQFVLELGVSVGRELPFVYRVHEEPAAPDVTKLVHSLHELGLPYNVEQTVTPEDYRRILSVIQNFEFRDFIERIAFYSMTKAEYRPRNSGHFGLAFTGYTHFTSPIRRYADLEAHRLLRRYLGAAREMGLPEGGTARDDSAAPRTAGPSNGRVQKRSRAASDRGRGKDRGTRNRVSPGTLGEPLLRELGVRLEGVCERCSAAEKIATSAEREYTKLKSLEFIAQRVGNSYEGIISGVTSFGIFVELSRYLIEGLVRVADLPGDFYTYDERNFRFVGQK
ncbi:MAG TPA: VacB/RNase II family 3'-5' exoribonuclease, partial [Spirochaetia bacterium]|nr:VacB/RNase II family 3'-5' exoribonuclease [Spirochaetia bacterium]